MKPGQAGTGSAGEIAARRHLEMLGYRIIAAGFRTRMGEADLVAREAGDYVFVEVKTRRSRIYGLPEESITPSKQQRLRAVAQEFLAREDALHAHWRIDVVVIELGRGGRVDRVEVIRNAVSGT